MPRRSRKQDIESGILSVQTAADLIDLSPQTIKKLCSNGEIKAGNISTVPERKEWRIPAPNLLLFCESRGIEVPTELVDANVNFSNKQTI